MAGARNSRLQLIAAKARQRRRAHVGLHANRHRDAAAVDVSQRFGHRQRVGVVQPRAAVFFGLGQPQQAQIAQFLEHLVRRKDLRRFPFVHMRVDFFVDQALQRLLDFQVFVGVVHGLLSMMLNCLKMVHIRATPNCMGRSCLASRFRAHGQALRQHGAGVARVDHAIVQQQARGVKRIGLRVEQAHDLVELRLRFDRVGRQPFARQPRLGHDLHGFSRLLAAHDGGFGVRPAEQKARLLAATAHAVVARAKRRAALDGDLRHGGVGHRLDHLASRA